MDVEGQMANLKVTSVEGMEQFSAEGDEATVKALLVDWRTRNDALRAEAQDYVERLGTTRGIGPTGLPGISPTSPFRPRSS